MRGMGRSQIDWWSRWLENERKKKKESGMCLIGGRL